MKRYLDYARLRAFMPVLMTGGSTLALAALVYGMSNVEAMTAEHRQENENELSASVTTPSEAAAQDKALALHLEREMDAPGIASTPAGATLGGMLAGLPGDDAAAMQTGDTVIPFAVQSSNAVQNSSAGSGDGTLSSTDPGLSLNTIPGVAPGSGGIWIPNTTGTAGMKQETATEADGMMLSAAPDTSLMPALIAPQEGPAGTGGGGIAGDIGADSLTPAAPSVPGNNPVDLLVSPGLTNPDETKLTGPLEPGFGSVPFQPDDQANEGASRGGDIGLASDEITRTSLDNDASRTLLSDTRSTPVSEPSSSLAIYLGLLGLLGARKLRSMRQAGARSMS